MKKLWKKTAEGIYDLYIDSEVKGSLSLQFNSPSRKAIAIIDEDVYEITAKGFWKPEITITDFTGNEIMNVKPAKWYGTTYDVSHGPKTFRLEIRNNPLAEWALLDGDKLVCSYGLDVSNGKAALKIGSNGNNQLLYDFLLWYLFLPIATEQTGDAFVFNMSAQ